MRVAAFPLVNSVKNASFCLSAQFESVLDQRFSTNFFCASLAGDERHLAARYNLMTTGQVKSNILVDTHPEVRIFWKTRCAT